MQGFLTIRVRSEFWLEQIRHSGQVKSDEGQGRGFCSSILSLGAKPSERLLMRLSGSWIVPSSVSQSETNKWITSGMPEENVKPTIQLASNP